MLAHSRCGSCARLGLARPVARRTLYGDRIEPKPCHPGAGMKLTIDLHRRPFQSSVRSASNEDCSAAGEIKLFPRLGGTAIKPSQQLIPGKPG
jgi:hypothetical protein